MAKMTKNQLIDAIAEGTQVSKEDVRAVIEQMATVGYKELNESGEFVIPGFIKMSVYGVRGQAGQQVGQGVTPEGCQRRGLKRTGWLRPARSPELWVIPPAPYAPRDGISRGPS